jgi:hypothetical protein
MITDDGRARVSPLGVRWATLEAQAVTVRGAVNVIYAEMVKRRKHVSSCECEACGTVPLYA